MARSSTCSSSSSATRPTPPPPRPAGTPRERRHVHFGVSHISQALRHDPDLDAALVAAAEARAAKLLSLSGLSPVLIEALVVMAARSRQPAELADAAAAVQDLKRTMERTPDPPPARL